MKHRCARLALLLGVFIALQSPAALADISPRLLKLQELEPVQSSRIYSTAVSAYFNEAWQSMRIFPLLQPLRKPLKIYIDKPHATHALDHDNAIAMVHTSMTQWSQALGGRLRYEQAPSPTKADISIFWIDGFSDTFQGGEAEVMPGKARIRIKARQVDPRKINVNLMHELGHALGIAGHSHDNNDVMVGVRNWSHYNAQATPTLSGNDIAAIRKLYSPEWREGEHLFNIASTP